jgi:peroxiredoxin
MIRNAARILLFLGLGSGWARAGVEEDWQAILDLDAGPQVKFTSRAQAQSVTLEHLDRQEEAVREFVGAYPSSPEAVDAQLRLARIYMVRGDLSGNRALADRAFKVLADLESDPATPARRLADVAFARMSLEMRRAQRNLGAYRDGLVKKADAFAAKYPDDRRIAPLYAELAGVFDDKPALKKRLLEDAGPRATDEALKMQIADDLKRLRMLGSSVDLKFRSLQGQEITVSKLRGRVVVICFFAGWSPPSIISLAKTEELARNFPPHQVRVLGISLDSDVEQTRKLTAKFGIDWPVYCDGKGWESPLVRSLGINALPTVWVLDGRGRLRFLNARDEPERAVRALVRER